MLDPMGVGSQETAPALSFSTTTRRASSHLLRRVLGTFFLNGSGSSVESSFSKTKSSLLMKIAIAVPV
jgi:hypothetical protein